MIENPELHFAKRYHAALRRHLSGGMRDGSSSRLLGRDAVGLGLNSVDLARVHDRSMSAMAPKDASANNRNGDSQLTKAGLFFQGALTPLETANRATKKAAARARRLDELLRKRNAALADARRTVRIEGGLRKADEKRLELGARHYNQLLARSHRMQDQLRSLAHQVLRAQEDERKEISRELHDEVAQILAGINVQLATLKEVSAIDNQSLRKRITQTQRLVQQSVEVVHRYARELRPAMLDDLGLVPALRSFIQDLPGRKNLRVRFMAFSGVERLDNNRRTVLFRVAQEALTNVARHAHARLVSVRVGKVEGAVRLEVHDNGRSFQVEKLLASNANNRLGLLGMRERVEMIGGIFSIVSVRGKGTTIRAEIPFSETPSRASS